MRFRTGYLGLLIMFGGVLAPYGRADEISFPGNGVASDTESSLPFGDLLVASYQQVYNFSSLQKAITISELDFTMDPTTIQAGADIAAESYSVSLTPVDPAALDLGSSIAADVGAAPPTAGNASLELDGNTLRLILNTPTPYDPSQGAGLLLDVEQVSFDPASPQFSFAMLGYSGFSSAMVENQSGASCLSGCVFDGKNVDNSGNPLPEVGLVTTFVEAAVPQNPPSSAPEPASLPVFAVSVSLLAMAGRLRGRTRAR